MTTINWSLQIKHDTAANWASDNPVLLEGQIGAESNAGVYDKLKIGDGVTAWNALAYFGGGGQVDSVVGTTNRITVDATDPVNPIVDISSTYDTAITNAISSAVSGKKNIVTQTTGTALTFTTDRNYGTIGSPETGNITADITAVMFPVSGLPIVP